MKRNKIYKSNDYPKLLPFIILGLFVLSSVLYIGYMIGKNQASKLLDFNEITITPEQPTITPTSTQTITPSPVVISNPQPQKVALHIDSIDWIDGHAAGLITSDIRVQLFTMDGRLIEEKTPSVYVQNGPVGSGGDTVFYVIPSTYYIVSETPSKKGTCTITVRSTTEYNSCAIYLVNK